MSIKKDAQTELTRFIELCYSLNHFPSNNEMSKNSFSYIILDRCAKEIGYETWMHYCASYGFISKSLIMVDGKYKNKGELDIEDIINIYRDYYINHNHFPNANESRTKYNLPSRSYVLGILKYFNMSLQDLYNKTGFVNTNPLQTHWDKSKYDIYVGEFILQSNTQGYPLKRNQLEHNIKIPYSKWMIENCPTKIKSYNEFIEYCGLKPRYEISKGTAIKFIYEMQEKLNRPLMYDDFRNPSIDEIGISTINNIWGSLNAMKKELNLEIVQESMIDKQITLDKIKDLLKNLCINIYNKEKRTIISWQDIDECPDLVCSNICNKYFKRDGTTLRKYIKSIGFALVNSGRGFVYTYPDGETVYSRYEYIYSNYLRNWGFVYNVDYLRDIKYSIFITNHKSNLNCDYIIRNGNSCLYIEIAGMLRDYKFNYINDVVINESSKERYRLKLKEKETLLKSANLTYRILFPSDISTKR